MLERGPDVHISERGKTGNCHSEVAEVSHETKISPDHLEPHIVKNTSN